MSGLSKILYEWGCSHTHMVVVSTRDYHQFTPVDDLPFEVKCLLYPSRHQVYYFFTNLEDAERLTHMLRFRKLKSHELITITKDKLEELFNSIEEPENE